MTVVLTVLQVIASVGLIATVLLQSGKSAGMSGAIAGGAETVFGKKKEWTHYSTSYQQYLLSVLW